MVLNVHRNRKAYYYIRDGVLRLLPHSYQYSNLSEGTDRVGGQMRGDKEYPFSGVTNFGSLECGAGKRRCLESQCGHGDGGGEGGRRRRRTVESLSRQSR